MLTPCRFDSASLAILDRLNYAIQLLETQSSASVPQQITAPTPGQNTPGRELNDDNNRTPNEGHMWAETSQKAGNESSQPLDITEAALSDALNISSRPACTHILEWPIFGGRVQPESIKPTGPSPVPSVVARIHEDEVIGLVEGFLRNVHTKNPVLDPMDLLGLARDVTEQGFGWDDASCLVLIASALGGLAPAWDAAVPVEGEHSLSDFQSFRLAEAYYTAARKRLGLLDTSIMATQCCFLTGVYEMYSMRPLTAWSSFNRACTMLQLHLYAESGGRAQSFTRPEQCLYWSCLKSECEMREELVLPPSGLAIIGYPGVFPSPPGPTSSTDVETPGSRAWESVHESSWYYYLSDIAYRRMANRATTMLYCVPKERWTAMGGSTLHRIADELDNQVLQWWENIPGSPSSILAGETDELTYMLWLNYVDLRERIWRPFVYLAVHDSTPETDTSLVSAGAQKCLDMCFQTLEGARLKHRHHGLWLTIRCMFSKALLIIAAAKSENNLEMPEDWQRRVEEFQDYMRYWEEEAPECKGIRLALESLMGNDIL